MKILSRFGIVVGKVFIFIIILLLTLLTLPYINTTYYKFPAPSEFEGNMIYNPYQNIDSSHWKKANFQVQSYAWGGLTNGRKNSNELIDSIYSFLDYDIIATSDYMKINKHRLDHSSYIPIYEHGYSILKHHQICLGAEKVDWRDYFFFQNLHHKQHIINILKESNELVFIAHPKLREAFDPKDFAYLTNYDGIEVLNNYRISTEHWDAALSSGHYVTILSNDDAHNIFNPDEVGHYCTMINSPTDNNEQIMLALKKGRAYGASIYRDRGDSYGLKKEKLSELAKLEFVDVNHDTMKISVDLKADEFKFIGQNGDIKQIVKKSKSASYVFKPDDTYIRIEVGFSNGNKLYLNPIAKYDGESFKQKKLGGVNYFRTWIFRIISFFVIMILFFNLIYLWKWIIK